PRSAPSSTSWPALSASPWRVSSLFPRTFRAHATPEPDSGAPHGAPPVTLVTLFREFSLPQPVLASSLQGTSRRARTSAPRLSGNSVSTTILMREYCHEHEPRTLSGRHQSL